MFIVKYYDDNHVMHIAFGLSEREVAFYENRFEVVAKYPEVALDVNFKKY